MITMCLGLLTETAGYVSRVLLNGNPFNRDYFLWYLITLTIGPVFIAAAIYLTLGRIVVVYGEAISRIKPRTYTTFFLGCDIVSLVVQAVGGGIAASTPVTNQSMVLQRPFPLPLEDNTNSSSRRSISEQTFSSLVSRSRSPVCLPSPPAVSSSSGASERTLSCATPSSPISSTAKNSSSSSLVYTRASIHLFYKADKHNSPLRCHGAPICSNRLPIRRAERRFRWQTRQPRSRVHDSRWSHGYTSIHKLDNLPPRRWLPWKMERGWIQVSFIQGQG